jgi:hypothetical protein
MENEIEKVEPAATAIQVQSDAPPMVQVAQLLANGVDIDVDKMAKIQDMSERYDAGLAKKAFFAAMSEVQSEVEGVIKTKKNAQTNSMYASLDGVIEMAKPIYTKHGFSVIFSEGKADTDGEIRILADVLHKDGHERPYHYDLAVDDKGIKGSINKTKIHGKASSISYGRRYLMCMIWNIPTSDNDGNGADNQPAKLDAPDEAQSHFITQVTLGLTDIASEQGRRPDAKLVQNWLAVYNSRRGQKDAYPSDGCLQ